MTKLLEQAFSEASKLTEEEQDALARAILEELDAEHNWDTLFEQSHDLLKSLADEALKEYRTGRSKPLDPDQL